MTRHRFGARLSLLIMLALGAHPDAQQPPSAGAVPQRPGPTFRAEVNYVEVDATVVDASGNFVGDLKREDFQLFEDGKPQQISAFMPVNVPVERAEAPLVATTPVEPDVQSNEKPFEGRLWVLLIDDLHVAPYRTAQVRQAAKRFIERYIGANDLTAVLTTSGNTQGSQDFTANKRLPLAAVDRVMGQKTMSATLEALPRQQLSGSGRYSDQPTRGELNPLDAERAYHAQTMLRDLRGVADALEGVHGRRKAFVLISEGIDYDINDVIGNTYASSIIDDARDAIAAVTRANASVYAVDPRGLTQLGAEAIEIGSLPPDSTSRLGLTSLRDELRLSQDSLRILADQTGGFAVVNQNDLNGGFERIVRDNSSYYLLGYYPTNDKRDGKFRKIEVRVNRPGVAVHARKGYYAARGKAPAPQKAAAGASPAEATATAAISSALGSPIPQRGLPIRVFAAPFRTPKATASVPVLIEADISDLPLETKGDRLSDAIDINVTAVDRQGKVRGGKQNSVNLNLRPETFQALKTARFRAVEALELPPGTYQLHVAVRDRQAGRVGTVAYDLDVPDFSAPTVTMSGILIGTAADARVPIAASEEDRKVLGIPPAARRLFSRADELDVYAEVYDNPPAKSGPVRVDIATTIRTDDGREVFRSMDERTGEELAGSKGGFVHTVKIPLKDLAPGLYILRVGARDRAGRGEANREVLFRIAGPAPARSGHE